MRIGELSRQSGAPVATIKYYLREGLLPSGERTHANQVTYGPGHLRRLRLVRALISLGGLPVRAARSVLRRLDDNPDMTLFAALGKAQYALLDPDFDQPDRHVSDATTTREAARLIERMGWSIGPYNPARQALADELAEAQRLGLDDLLEQLHHYAAAANTLAELDIALMLKKPDGGPVTERDEAAERMIALTVVGDRLLTVLRRLAQEDTAARRLQPAHRLPLPPRPSQTSQTSP